MSSDLTRVNQRFIAVDVFRGITIALMILVNSPGNGVAYRLLQHANWNGCTLADLVFPFFIILVGMSSVLALSNLSSKGLLRSQFVKKILLRTSYLFGMGLLLNFILHPADLAHIRIMGVLQRLALCYLFSSLLFLTTRARTQGIIALVLLSSYWILLRTAPLSPDLNWAGFVDRLLLTPQHLYTPVFDPEGLLSTLPAIASALLGNLLGYCLLSTRTKEQQLQWMIKAGLILLLLGSIWQEFFPFNKDLWSSSYALWSGGLAFLIFALCFALTEIKQYRRGFQSFSLLGKNAMLLYVLHILGLKIQALILIEYHPGEWIKLRLYLSDLLFSHFTQLNASLFYAISYTLFWLLVLHGINWWRRSSLLNTLHNNAHQLLYK